MSPRPQVRMHREYMAPEPPDPLVPRAVCPRCKGMGFRFPAPLFGCSDPCDLCECDGLVELPVLTAWRAARLAGACG